MKLNGEEKQLLEELCGFDGYKVLIKVIDEAASPKDLLSYNLQDGAEGLAYTKAKYEGALALSNALKTFLAHYRTPKH